MASNEFTGQPEVQQAMAELEKEFGENGKRPLLVSDVKDAKGHQYVNLVQEGGGMLGIALVGFTYVLEKMGIRFWRLAGTSAGAINTLLLASIGKKDEEKSEKVLSHLSEKRMLDFVDGHPIVSRLLTTIVKNKYYISNTLFFIIGCLCIFLLSMFFGLLHHSSAMVWLVLAMLLLLAIGVGYFYYLLQRFKKSSFGLCKGDEFSNWIQQIISAEGIHTLKDLRERAYLSGHDKTDVSLQLADNGKYRSGESATVDSLESDVTMIACDITTQMKVEFPRMAMLYGMDENTPPSQFVRASMSIPVFFESFGVKHINTSDPRVIREWESINYKGPLPTKANFVDGGIISNFPISVFHNDKIRTPRLPVIGVRLSEGEDAPVDDIFSGIGNYVGAVFSTIRFNYDKEFLSKNNFYTKYVAPIDVRGFNWLNFSMSKAEQKKLFLQGVKTAKEYLLNFNWTTYKAEREQLFDTLNNKKS